nr:glycosyltransferase family 4 protein [uncultured Acetobacterium sp.]
MQIAMVHGYFLNGTGSNLLVQNLCREFCKMGHDVRLFCQENDGNEFDFIEKVYEFDVNNTVPTRVHQKETPYLGKCFLYRPNLNGFLPVFVHDHYTGYRVKAFVDCTQQEIENYLDANRNAFNNGLKSDEIDMIISNHTIMQPVYIARSSYDRLRSIHVMIMHGSCLNFAVRKSELLQGYAEESILDVDKIVFISNYSKEEFSSFFNWEKNFILEKSVVIPGGVDLNQFQPLNDCEEKKIKIMNALTELKKDRSSSAGNSFEEIDGSKADTIKKLSGIDFEREEVVIYYGKYLWTKGLHLLIAAAPLIMQKSPNVRFLFVGFGSSLSYFYAMIDALDNRSKVEFIQLIEHPVRFGYEVDQTTARFFNSLIKKLVEPSFADDYFRIAENKIKKAIVIVGYLGHEHLNPLIACSALMVAPSIFPEAFGLVGIEALASGIIPVQTNQSGFSEVVNVYQTEFADELNHLNLKELRLDEHLVENLGLNIATLLSYNRNLSPAKKQLIRKKAHQICIDHYSWEIIAKQYLEISND